MPDGADRHVVLSGCSGGGKSALLAELGSRGFATVPEPGRRIVDRALAGLGGPLPWVDLAAFARKAIDMSRADRRAAAATDTWLFFDRGLIDAAAALAFATKAPLAPMVGGDPRFHRQVFVTPPWRDLFVQDDVRRHGWPSAIAEYDRLCAAYAELGYAVTVLPKTGIAARADFLLDRLDQPRIHASIAAQP
jgi:predicted ATPase